MVVSPMLGVKFFSQTARHFLRTMASILRLRTLHRLPSASHLKRSRVEVLPALRQAPDARAERLARIQAQVAEASGTHCICSGLQSSMPSQANGGIA
jgi:hypothetical protein